MVFPSPKTGRCCIRPIRDSWNRNPSTGKARRHFPREAADMHNLRMRCGIRLSGVCFNRSVSTRTGAKGRRVGFARFAAEVLSSWRFSRRVTGGSAAVDPSSLATSTRIFYYLDVDNRAKLGPMLQDRRSRVAQTSHRPRKQRKKQISSRPCHSHGEFFRY